ncbi:MAG TPA: MFS transporter [Anaerolineaceae bacterium]|nr:MFS transporter [Anaerolineaceae bacterium]
MSSRPAQPTLQHPQTSLFSPVMRPFAILWLGELVSLFGSALTSFALGLWVYQRSGSVTQYALISLAAVLPRVLVSPFAGVLVDRWDRRRNLLLSDLGAGLSSLAAAALLIAGRLDVGLVYLLVGLSAVCAAFQSPAYVASIPLLVPAPALSRANGMIQLSQSLAEVFAPLAAGFLVLAIRVQGVLLIDFATFLVAVSALAVIRIPSPAAQLAVGSPGIRALLGEARDGWRFISDRPGLVALLIFAAIFNFLWGMVGALAAPLVLSFSDSGSLGIFLTVAGCGMLAGSLAMSAWVRGPRRKIGAILAAELASGLGFILIGLRPSLVLAAAGALIAHLTIAVIGSSSRTLWQRKVPAGMLGRVFAIQEMVARSAAPLAIAAAGPLAERVFEPLLVPGGPLAASLGLLTGAGAGRGIGLMFLCMGLLKAAVALCGALYRPLRAIETD